MRELVSQKKSLGIIGEENLWEIKKEGGAGER